MNFSDALHYVKAGRAITRPAHIDGSRVALVTPLIGQPQIMFLKRDCPTIPYEISADDLLATDWQIVRDPALSGAAVDQADGPAVIGAPEFEPLSAQRHASAERSIEAARRPDFDLDGARFDAITGGRFAKERAEAEKARFTAPPSVEIAHAFEDLRDKLEPHFGPLGIWSPQIEQFNARLREAEFWALRHLEEFAPGQKLGLTRGRG